MDARAVGRCRVEDARRIDLEGKAGRVTLRPVRLRFRFAQATPDTLR
jgi:hypothetical protein